MQEWKLSFSFNFNNREIKYDTKGEGEPLILVHGTPWSSFNLRHLINKLSKSYKVYYFDLLGYGQSDKKEGDVSLAVQNKVLKELINHWGLVNPYIIGHDFGGTTVLRSHLLDEVQYKKIVLIDPVAISPWGSAFFKHVEKYEEAFSGVPDYIHKAIVETYIKTAAHQELDELTINGILEPWLSENGKEAFYRQIAQANSSYTDEFQEKFDRVKSDVLILWGEEDKWIPVKQAHKLHSNIKTSKLVTVPNTGHLVIEEDPTSLYNEITSFFN